MNDLNHNSRESAALRRLAKQETEREERERRERIAELRQELDAIDSGTGQEEAELRTRIRELNAKHESLAAETVAVARQRDKAQVRLQGMYMTRKTRKAELDKELRLLEGRQIPVPKLHERPEHRKAREEFEEELTGAV